MKPESLVVHAGRKPEEQSGTVNPPIYQTSTLLFPTVADYRAAEKGKAYHPLSEHLKSDASYAITGTRTTAALAEAIAKLEGGDATLIFPSGLAAITVTLMSLLSAGDHVLILDSVYGPTRRFCTKELKRINVEVTYYDPLIGAGIADLIKDNTKLILLESPGSLTFEIQDVPAIVKAAKAKKPDIITVIDNSWATPLYFKPFKHGVDVSIQAATKYINGHSDILMGMVTANEPHISTIFQYYRDFGMSSSPYECYLVQRGLRSMVARLERHARSALRIAEWLEGRKEVKRVIYPALPSHPQHAIWKRDFTGACGLLTFVLHTVPVEAVERMIDGLEFFGIGASWGGYESLAIHFDPRAVRTATQWKEEGRCVRIHVGLEDPEDLIQDLEKGLERLR